MKRRGFFGSLLGLLGAPAKSQERIHVDLSELPSLRVVELDPAKKYLFVADPRYIDAKQLVNLDLEVDAAVIFSMKPSDPPDARDFIPCRYCNGTLPEDGGEMQHDAECPWNLGKLAAVKAMR